MSLFDNSFDEFNSDDSGGGSFSDVLQSLFHDAASVASSAINANSNVQAPPLYSPYGTRVPGAGVISSSSGIGNFVLIAGLAVLGILAAKKLAK